MDERFVHLRDKAGNLWVTIAYLRPDKNKKVKYAVTVVSPTEPPHVVSPRTGRAKTRARLSSSKGSDWRPYGREGSFHETSFPYRLVKDRGLQRIGWMDAETFRALVKGLRARLACWDPR